MSLHATEIGGTQMAPELTYDLLTRQDEETKRILDNVIFVMIPSFNPDGQIMVTDWYNETLGTEYEGINLPWLYHKYVGHDNNRDGDYLNMIESVYAAKIMYREWKPQAYIDHHHMGSYGARFYVPPYSEPIRPYADPLVWREMSLFGGHIAYKLEEDGKTGILNKAQYPGWGHFGWHWITPFHNIAGMLTESASARLATPLYIHPGSTPWWSPRAARVRSPDEHSESLAGRLVEAPGHRGAEEDLRMGAPRRRGPSQGDGALERLPEGQATNGTGSQRHAQSLRDPENQHDH